MFKGTLGKINCVLVIIAIVGTALVVTALRDIAKEEGELNKAVEITLKGYEA